MLIDAWVPVGFQFPNGAKAKMALAEGADWQIYETGKNSRVLVAVNKLAEKWIEQGLIEKGSFQENLNLEKRILRTYKRQQSRSLPCR